MLFIPKGIADCDTGVSDVSGVTGGCFSIFFIFSVLKTVHAKYTHLPIYTGAILFTTKAIQNLLLVARETMG